MLSDKISDIAGGDEPRPYGGSPRVFFLSGCAIPSRQTVKDKRDRGPTFL